MRTAMLVTAYGYFSCDFNTWPDGACGMTVDTETSSYVWSKYTGAGPNYPTTGPQSGDGYMLADSSQPDTVSVHFQFDTVSTYLLCAKYVHTHCVHSKYILIVFTVSTY